MSIDAIGSISGGYSGGSVSSVSRVADEDKEKFQFEDNIFKADFSGSTSGVGASNPFEETSGTLASKEPSGNLFEESAGQLASNDIKDFELEESAGQLANGGLNLVA